MNYSPLLKCLITLICSVLLSTNNSLAQSTTIHRPAQIQSISLRNHNTNPECGNAMVQLHIQGLDEEYFYRFSNIVITNQHGDTLSCQYSDDLFVYYTGAYFEIKNYCIQDSVLNFDIHIQIIHRENDILVYKIPIINNFSSIKTWDSLLTYFFIDYHPIHGNHLYPKDNPALFKYLGNDTNALSAMYKAFKSAHNFDSDKSYFIAYTKSLHLPIVRKELWHKDAYRLDMGRMDVNHYTIFDLYEPIDMHSYLYVYIDSISSPITPYTFRSINVQSYMDDNKKD